MKIRQKTSLVYLILTIALVISFVLYSNKMSTKSINELEDSYANDNLNRAVNLINSQIINLDHTCKDWAYWDDTYQFAQGQNEEYASANLKPEALMNIQLNFFVVADSKGNIVQYMALNTQNSNESLPSPEFYDYLSKNMGNLVSAANEKDIKGLLFLDGKPLMISINPILTSLRTGPSKGILIMGQYLSEAEVTKISEILDLPIYIYGSEEIASGKDSFESENYVIRYKTLNDIDDKPSILLRVDTPNNLFELSRKQMSFSHLAVTLTGAFFILASLLLIDKLVLSRISKLSKDITQTDKKGFVKRINVEGNDEISYLSNSINNMLQNIKDSQKELKNSEEKFKSYVENAPDGIFITDSKGNYVDVNEAACKITGYSREELLKLNLIDLIPDEAKEKAAKSFTKVVSTGKVSTDVSFIKKGGEKRYWTVEAVKLSEDRILGFAKDITKRTIAEEKLKQSEEKYRELVENANSIISKFGKDGQIISMNEFGLRFFGYTEEEIIGKTWNETILPKIESTGKILENLAAEIVKEPDRYSISINENIKKNGERIWVHWNNKPVYDSKGDLIAMLCIGNDITEKKKAEETLEKMKDILLETGRIAKIGGWEFEPETMKQIWTQELYDIYELPYEFQPTVNNGIKFYSPTSRPVIEKAVNDAIAEGTSFDLNLELITAKGNHKWVQTIGKAHIQNGEVIKVSGTIQDITDRIKLEKHLIDSEEKYRELANSLPEIVFETDEKGNLTFVNLDSLSLTGYTKEDFEQGLNATQLLIPEDRVRASESIQKLFSGVKIGSTEYTALRKDGSTFPVLINSNRIGSKNKPIGLRGILFDITERKKAEAKINSLNEALRIINKILRHDILNDLTVVMMACDMIQVDDQRLKQKASKALNKSVALIEQMRTLEIALVSDEVLAGKSLRSVAESVVKNYPNIKFSIKGDCNILCDEALSSVIDNLVRNAVVHGKTDRIDISIDDKDKVCEMRIADYGKGIPSDIKDRIFGEGESFGDTKGSGLGLYIVKKVMERYGGEISFEDNKPNGAVFVLKFKKA